MHAGCEAYLKKKTIKKRKGNNIGGRFRRKDRMQYYKIDNSISKITYI